MEDKDKIRSLVGSMCETDKDRFWDKIIKYGISNDWDMRDLNNFLNRTDKASLSVIMREPPKPGEIWRSLDGDEVKIIGISGCYDSDVTEYVVYIRDNKLEVYPLYLFMGIEMNWHAHSSVPYKFRFEKCQKLISEESQNDTEERLMTLQEACQLKEKICKNYMRKYKNPCAGLCPLSKDNADCNKYIIDYPDRAASILQRWGVEYLVRG